MNYCALALASLAIGIGTSALAHDHWIQNGHYHAQDGSGQICCGEHDCETTAVTHIPQMPYGKPEDGFMLPTGELVPRSRVQPSEDNDSWVCRRHDKTIRCLFVPGGGMS